MKKRYGYSFEGTPIVEYSFDLNSETLDEELAEMLAEITPDDETE